MSQFVGNAIGRGVVPVWAIGGAGDQNTYFHSGMMWPSVDEKGQFYRESYVMKDEDAIALARNAARRCNPSRFSTSTMASRSSPVTSI